MKRCESGLGLCRGALPLKRRAWILLAGLVAAAAAAQEIPSAPKGGAVLPEWQAVSDTASAQKLFVPSADTPAVERLPDGAVRLSVNFAETRAERVTWDLGVKADLRGAKGIQFDFYCRDLSPFTSFSLYFRSGGGWYHASFSPEESGVWQRVTVDKSDTRTEGQPAGWGAVDGLRLSGWRGDSKSTVCAIANLGVAGGHPEVLVVCAESNIQQMPSEARGFGEYAATVSATLEQIGVESAQVADTDLSPALLKGIKLIVLPYNPRVPEKAVGLLRAFVEGGGKVLVCYSLAEGVDGLLGLTVSGGADAEGGAFGGFARAGKGLTGQPDFARQGSWRTALAQAAPGKAARVVAVWRDAKGSDTALPAITVTPTGAFVGHVWFYPQDEAGTALMRALVGELVPGVWRQAAQAAFDKIGVLAGARDFAAFREGLEKQASRDARRELAAAAKGRDEAAKRLKDGQWEACMAASDRASVAALRAWCLSQKPAADEHRAFWCHSAFGLGNKGWDESIRLLKESGFNAILPNMAWGGLAYYPSKVLPEYAECAQNGDQIAQCLAACKKYGVKCHVWKVDWNTGGRAPRAFIERMVAQGRVQKDFSGQVNEEWLCPSHPDNRALEAEAMLEIVRNYAVDGVHFDYIRYPGGDACFCDGCRARFEAVLGHPVAAWPAATRQPGEVRDRWLDFRRANISSVVQRVAEEARKVRPGVQISAAVFRNWPTDRDSVGQDWKVWCDNRWLDFVCPMDYVDSNSIFRNTVMLQKGYAGQVPLYPGIGLSCWKNPRDAVKIAQQIAIARELGLKGYTVFNYDGNAEAVLPYLRLGATSR